MTTDTVTDAVSSAIAEPISGPPAPGGPALVEAATAAARAHPEREAVLFGAERLTWGELDERAARIAGWLAARGVGRGDRVALLSPNSATFVAVMMGVLRAGAALVPLSTMAAPDVLARMVRDSGARLLLVADALRPLAADAADVERVALDFEAEGWASFDPAAAPPVSPVPTGPDDLFAILYSSGTTGVPKGVAHDNRFRTAQNGRMQALGLREGARTLVATPLYSHATLTAVVPTLAGGGTLVIAPPGRFDADKTLALMARERVTHAMLVPVQYKRLTDASIEAHDLATLEVTFCTSAPLREDVKRAVVARLPGQLIELYGATEGGATTVLRTAEHPDKLHTVGRPGPGVVLRFIDEEGREVPAGETGEVCGRAPSMMRGYWNNADATGAAVWRDAAGETFIRSGDIGRLDEDGFLVLSDRRKDMIVSGGLNVYADDLERVLLALPQVEDAAVIGVPSEDWGETPLAFVVLSGDASGDVPDGGEAVLEQANARLGRSQRLSGVEVVDALPRSPIGKILKRELRAPYWAGREKGIA